MNESGASNGRASVGVSSIRSAESADSTTPTKLSIGSVQHAKLSLDTADNAEPTKLSTAQVADRKSQASVKSHVADRKSRGHTPKTPESGVDRKLDKLRTVTQVDAFSKQDSEVLRNATELEASQKFANGEFTQITYEEICELFHHLSKSDNALVPFQVIGELLMDLLECSDVEMDALRQHIDVHPGGVISARQLERAINVVSIQTLLRQVHRDKLRRRSFSELGGDVHVERDLLVDRVNWRVDRDDAFGTLPFTAVYMIIFMCLVVHHLQVWRRQELERGIESWIANQGEHYYGPFLYEHVYSPDSFKQWMHVSGLPGVFGDVRNHTDGVELRMGNTNILVGDVLLRQHHGSNYDIRSEWLLHSQWGQALLQQPNQALEYLAAARATASYLLSPNNSWIDSKTKDIEVVFCTYNNQAEMYALSMIRLPLDSYGYVKPIIKAKAVLIHAYPSMAILIADVAYFLYIFYIIYSECKDMCAAIRLGWKEFMDYWTVWNVIDWWSITFGFVNAGLWIICWMYMRTDTLQGLLNDKDKMTHAVMNLPTAQLDRIHDALRAICRAFFALHIAVAVTTISIVLKFFKGFQANPRLQTVTMTLRCVAVDVFHFFIVFITIFASFAVIGHVLFGSDITKFYTLASSFNTGITVLMGEFDWYVELIESPDTLPSGMPRFVLIMWFVIYMFFVLLVMLNMLLAIILERYTEVNNFLSSRSDARTLWSQWFRYFNRIRETRGFIPLYKIRRDLENDNDPAHPAKVVTKESLEEAFPGMKDEQADWIMRFLETELRERVEESRDDASTARAKRTERFVQSIAEELHTISHAVSSCSDRIQRLEASVKNGKLSAS